MDRTQQLSIIKNVRTVPELISQLRQYCNTGDWLKYSEKLITWLENPIGKKLPFTCFTEGNSKLPFYSFSALPYVTCPGMGECAKFCYSLKAFRYPCAFFRQIQNTVLVLSRKDILAREFIKLCDTPKLIDGFDFRLYVDGDFDSLETIEFWFTLLNAKKNCQAYGYSKSWHLLTSFKGTFPTNYALNVSSGSRFLESSELYSKVCALPITRGAFTAHKVNSNPSTDFRAYALELKSFYPNERVNICTGKCGACRLIKGKNVHLCGSLEHKERILIGIH